MRIILYTGKGGVGKTSLSAATAVRSAEMGHRTLVLSTDAAHSLGDALDRPIDSEPTEVADNLFAQEIDVTRELRENWTKIQTYVADFLKNRGLEEVLAEEFAILPGMEELFCLLRLGDYDEREAYDVAVIDCAPTSSTIRMLSFPDIARWYMEKFFHLERRVIKAIKPIAERVAGVPLPDDGVFFSVEELYKKVEGMKGILTDVERSSIRLVCNPEKMVIQETRRAYTYFNLFGFPIDAVLANRVLSEDVTDAYFDSWKAIQERYLAEVDEGFAPLRIFRARLYEREMIGIPALSTMASDIFGDEDPATIFHKESPMKFEKGPSGYSMRLRLPFTEKGDLDLWVKEGELILKAGDLRRNILLPRTLADRTVARAKFKGDFLYIEFGARQSDG